MHKSLLIIGIFLTAILGGMFIGCDDSSTSAPAGSGGGGNISNIELRVNYSLLSGMPGEQVSMQITAIARDALGVGVQGIAIKFGIKDVTQWKGTIAKITENAVTDVNGEILANYSVVLDRDTDVTLYAQFEQVEGEKVIQLKVRDDEGTLSIQVERTVLTVPPDQTKTTQVTATLVDSSGLAIPGVEIQFSTEPATLGFVDSDTAVTNNAGMATRTFSSIVNRYGTCNVIASLNATNTISQAVQIRPVAGPKYIVVEADPKRVQIEPGENSQSIIQAVVTDSTGVGVEGARILFELESIGGEPIFGSLTSIADSTTDADGRISTIFNSRGIFGEQKVVARVIPSDDSQASVENPGKGNLKLKAGDNSVAGIDEDLSAHDTLSVGPITNALRYMSVNATPSHLALPPDSTGMSIIQAIIKDGNRNGIANLRVDFSTNMGTLARPTVTDSSGVATVEFFVRPSDDLNPIDLTAFATITASIPGNPQWDTEVQVEIEPVGTGTGSLQISITPRYVWADGPGKSQAVVTVILQDENGQSLANQPIEFRTSFVQSAVQSPVNTDSLGMATTVFDDNWVPSTNPETGFEDSVTVTAFYESLNLTQTAKVMVKERNPITDIALHVNAVQMIAGSYDSSAARANCFLASGDPAPAGQEVFFNANLGQWTSQVALVEGISGAADTYYIAGNSVGVDTLYAYIKVQDSISQVSNTVLISLLAGPPSAIYVDANPRILFTNDPNAASIVRATVTDTSGNPVRPGTYVTFSSSLGTITPSSTTSELGVAEVRLTPGVAAGTAVITGTVSTQGGDITSETTVQFISGNANQIILEADPLEIAVQGTGENGTSTLTATVRDPNGNLVEQPVTVVFRLLNEPPPPAGCTFGANQQVFQTQTANGYAVASLNSGRQIGGKLVRAITWPDSAAEPDDSVYVVLSNVAVVAGPPHLMDIDVNDDGDDAGGGALEVEVSARVWDRNRNPVANNIPVVFTVFPDIANIAPGHTGNVGASGNSVRGLAYARMVYNSINTFDPILISALVVAEEGDVAGEREHILPLQDGQLELNVDPENWMFEEGREEAVIRCWVVLTDLHQILINNGPILFGSNRAMFWWNDFEQHELIQFFPDATRQFTGRVDRVHNEERGQATVFLVAEADDIFLDQFTLEVTVQINASVEGYNDVQADPGFIFFTRRAR